jgi:hypothetical protein
MSFKNKFLTPYLLHMLIVAASFRVGTIGSHYSTIPGRMNRNAGAGCVRKIGTEMNHESATKLHIYYTSSFRLEPRR